jgi:hypothetical protein
VSEGVFQTDREIFNNSVWKNVLKFRLFFYIYGNAVYAEAGKDYSGIHLNRGQFLRSYRKLQEDLEYIENHAVKNYSLSQIKMNVLKLVQEKRIKVEVVQLGTLFTVCNYEEYQGFERFKNGSIEQRKNSVRTDKEQMKNNNKNDKNDKKDKNGKESKDIGALITEFAIDEGLKTAIQDFIEMRKLKRKPPTERAMKDIFKKLNTLSPDIDTQVKILERSIINSWTDIYPLKEEQQNSNPFM